MVTAEVHWCNEKTRFGPPGTRVGMKPAKYVHAQSEELVPGPKQESDPLSVWFK